MQKTKKYQHLVLFFIILLAIFFYSFNLHHTYLFSGDMARDSLSALRILKNKDITAIGPPLSFGQYGFREIYFGSLTYYFGALGLLLTNNNVLGPIYINIFFMVIGLIFFYKLACLYFKNSNKALVAAFFYGLSPAIVIHLRFYWNPNFIISIAPIFWYFYYQARHQKKQSLLFPFLAGFTGAVLINLHYFVAPAVLLVLLVFLFSKNKKNFIFYILGLIIGLLPLIFFELKNNFYLTNAIFFNLIKNKSYHFAYQPILARTWYMKIADLFRIIPIFLGFDYEATYIPILIKLNYLPTVILGILFLSIAIYLKVRNKIKLEKDFMLYLASCALVTTALSHEEFYLRYFFVCLPLLVLIICKILNQNKLIILISAVFMIINVRILYFQVHIFNHQYPYPTVNQIAKAVEFIKQDKPEKPYNITENFVGDARALYLRFFLEKDPAIPQPNDVTLYNGLKTLYVFAPNLNKIYEENRWEFNNTPNLKLTKTFKIDKNIYLYKFVRVD